MTYYKTLEQVARRTNAEALRKLADKWEQRRDFGDEQAAQVCRAELARRGYIGPRTLASDIAEDR